MIVVIGNKTLSASSTHCSGNVCFCRVSTFSYHTCLCIGPIHPAFSELKGC